MIFDKNNIERLCAFDFDGTLVQSPLPDDGKKKWEEFYNKPYPYIGWWSRIESLDLNVFDIKTYPSVYNQLKRELSIPNTYVIILTSRMEKLRPQIEKILELNGVYVHKIDMKKNNQSKGDRIIDYIKEFPNLKEINVYDDRLSDIESYEKIINIIPDDIELNIYLVSDGKIILYNHKDKLNEIIREEIDNVLGNIDLKTKLEKKLREAIKPFLGGNVVVGIRADNYKYKEGDILHCSRHKLDDDEGEGIMLNGTSVVPLWNDYISIYEMEDAIEEMLDDFDYIISIVKEYDGKYFTVAISDEYEIGWDEYGSRQELILFDAKCVMQIKR